MQDNNKNPENQMKDVQMSQQQQDHNGNFQENKNLEKNYYNNKEIAQANNFENKETFLKKEQNLTNQQEKLEGSQKLNNQVSQNLFNDNQEQKNQNNIMMEVIENSKDNNQKSDKQSKEEELKVNNFQKTQSNMDQIEKNKNVSQNNKQLEKCSIISQHGSKADKLTQQEQRQAIQEINKELHQDPQCEYSKVYCYGNCETDQFKVELVREGKKQQYYQTRKPFEIQEFNKMKEKILKLVTGAMHSVIITQNGLVYTWGNNDSGQLGREGEQTTPLKVDLEEPVDMVAAGESFTIVGSSQTGSLFFFGKIKSPFKNLIQHKEPVSIRYGLFKKNKIQDIKCGQNHILILSNQRVFVWGDVTQGALGNQFRRDISRVDFEKPTCINKRGVIKIFTTDFSSFVVIKKHGKVQRETIFAFGLNNHNQLGFESEDDQKGIEPLPVQWTEIYGDEIEDISGGEHHTFVLYKNGTLYGCGKNDEGQLGDIDKDAEPYGSFQKINHLPFKISKIICSSHFTYALDEQQKNYYAWGFGYDYVLANGKEDSLFKARKINNDKFFPLFPQIISFGTNFVTMVAGTVGDIRYLKNELKTKKKRRYKGPNLKKDKKRLQS